MKKSLITLISATFLVWWFSLASNYSSEQKDAYNYAYSQKITTVSTIEKASMNGELTRIAMAKMISNFAINVLWLQPNTSIDCSFSDVPSSLDEQYNYGVTQACQLWLMWIWNDWKKTEKFDSYGTVTRGQFATAFSRALSKAFWKVVENGDPYYSTHLQYLRSEWIINSTITPSPSKSEKRWNVMIMMMRASNMDDKINKNGKKNKWNSEYYYEDLHITANVWMDRKIDVLENFKAYFNVGKHWIIRVIPLSNVDITNVSVEWHKFIAYTEFWSLNIKIWDVDKIVNGIQIYPISYKIDWLIKEYSWYYELYWNLVWNDFDTNINKVRAELILPKVYTWFTADDFLITADWKSKTIDWFDWTVDWSEWDKIIITYDKWLSEYQWITLAIKFPSNYFSELEKKLTEGTKNIIYHRVNNSYNQFSMDDFNTVEDVYHSIKSWDRVIFLVRHSERITNCTSEWWLTEHWIELARWVWAKLRWDPFEDTSNDFYGSSTIKRTVQTSYYVGESRDSGVLNEILDDDARNEYGYVKHSSDIDKLVYSDYFLDAAPYSSIEHFYEENNEVAEKKALYMINELCAMTEWHSFSWITSHDVFVLPLTEWVTNEKVTYSKSKLQWPNFMQWVAIIVHGDGWWEAYPVRSLENGVMNTLENPSCY